MSKQERKVTHAIRFTGKGADPSAPLYICRPNEGEKMDYMYCCPCKETHQFADAKAGETFMERHNIPHTTHQVIDSVTAKKEKDARVINRPAGQEVPPEPDRPKSAIKAILKPKRK